MKKFAWIVIVFLVSFGVCYSQVLVLNSPETLAIPTATKLDLKNIAIDVGAKQLVVTYNFLSESGVAIPPVNSSSVDRRWYCYDRAAELAANCTGVGQPYAGCTGVGTGTNLYAGSTCFTDTFAFLIRTQDVGTQIGKGLRALIWAKMRPDVLSGSNNATLP